MSTSNKNRGYTLLFAVIVSSVVLSIAASILSISRKQLTLSSLSLDSTKAAYAADAGISCAREYGHDFFAPLDFTILTSPTMKSTASLSCNGAISASWSETTNSGTLNPKSGYIDSDITSKYKLSFTTYMDNGSCANVEVTSFYDKKSPYPDLHIFVLSSGYNMSDHANGKCPKIGNPRVVEVGTYTML